MLARETYVYDLYEQMGDAAETIERFHTRLDVRAWPARLAARVHVEPIVSGDRDLDPAAIEGLHARFGANVGDWESAAIAYVAAANRTPALILRGVSDVVDPRAGDPTYANDGAWERAAAQTMTALLALLAEAAPELAR